MTTVTWFRHDHEHRNDWLRCGFMRLSRQGVIRYVERDYEQRGRAGFDVVSFPSAEKAVSLIALEDGIAHRKCVVESNDSFYVMSHQIAQADIYFCAGYNSVFFKDRQLPNALSWQTESDVAGYRVIGTKMIERLGPYFGRAVPFIPIAPNLGFPGNQPWILQKAFNLRHKIQKHMLKDELVWSHHLADYERRLRQIETLRNRPVTNDIVLLDTLWGWPRHRVNLHRKLAELSVAGPSIKSRLQWSPPSELDGGADSPFAESNFPMTIGRIGEYEPMLAESRLAAFATGFHYGWRNILTFALMIGIPVLSDRIILEPWFGLNRFEINWNDDDDWNTLGSVLAFTSDSRRREIGHHNKEVFDQFMSPDVTAMYVLETALAM